jgi:hypothetical protein
MSVQLDAAIYTQRLASKDEKATMINHMACHLVGKCVVCWAWKKKMVSSENHIPFIGCRDTGDPWIDFGIGWIDFKKKYKLKPMQYCFRWVFSLSSKLD